MLRRLKLFEDLKADIKSGTWFEYEDNDGTGFAQTDILLLATGLPRLAILECKTTRCVQGWAQLEGLYRPILERVYPKRDLIRVQVYKNPAPYEIDAPIYTSILELLANAKPGYCELQWDKYNVSLQETF